MGLALQREFGAQARDFILEIDSAGPDLPWKMLQPPDDLDLHVDPFPSALFTIHSKFEAASGVLAGMQKPTIVFGPALEALQDFVNSLRAFVDLPFDVKVDVTAGHGPSPSFIVRMHLLLRYRQGPNSRIDIGIGKFHGRVRDRRRARSSPRAARAGAASRSNARGDVQQGIIPPVLYAGGAFRFRIEVSDSGKPLIEIGLGTAASIGGDLIKHLVEVEATVQLRLHADPGDAAARRHARHRGARQAAGGACSACLSASMRWRAFSAPDDDATVRIFADLRVAGSVQVAVFFEERVDFQTQFEQKLPLGPLLLAASGNPLIAAASTAAASSEADGPWRSTPRR